jgi:alpha-L-rhamnosidase
MTQYDEAAAQWIGMAAEQRGQSAPLLRCRFTLAAPSAAVPATGLLVAADHSGSRLHPAMLPAPDRSPRHGGIPSNTAAASTFTEAAAARHGNAAAVVPAAAAAVAGTGIAAATLDICGLGYYEAWLNSRRVGDHLLDPAQTDYTVRVMVVRHDVTALVQPGENVLGVMLGDGWYNQHRVWSAAQLAYGEPRLWAVLHCTHADGRETVVRSDATWRCSAGPVRENNVYAGETYDARREQPGWAAPGFDAGAWRPVHGMPAPGGRMELQTLPPIRAVETLRPVRIWPRGDATHLVDLGQNIAGWLRIRVVAPAGAEIRLRFAEALAHAGALDTTSTGVFATGVEQIDRYICRGDRSEEWEPRFTYHGFRYVELCGWPGTPTADDLTGVVVQTDLPVAGGFACADERLNQLHRMALWTHRGNVHSIPEDCPARERCGWLGDANVVAEYSLWNFAGGSFWEKYLDDIESTRALHDGLPCNIAPGKRTCGAARPDWAAALIMLPWYLYVRGGGLAILRRHWDGMQRVLEHFGAGATDWLLGGGFGDWCDPGMVAEPKTSPLLTTSMWFLRCAQVMTTVARLLEKNKDAARYAAWATHIRAAIIARFYDHARGSFGTQTADVLALQFDAAPAADAARIAHSLAADILAHDTHMTTGIMGVRYILEVLSRHGHGALAMALLHQDTYPSWGDMIARGATTLWECWGDEDVDQHHGARSCNHPMMGGYDNWFYTTLAGIMPDEANPGFAHFLLMPLPPPGLAWVRAWHACPRGRIESAWRREGGEFCWEFSVPAGCTATVVLPFSRRRSVAAAGTHSLNESCGPRP